MSEYVLYTTRDFSRGTVVQVLLEECGADYRCEYVSLPADESYRQINPLKKVPALLHQGQVITELAAIVLYLADQFHGKGLSPAPATPERGQMYRLLFTAVDFVTACREKMRGHTVSEEERIQNSHGNFADSHRAMTTLLAGKTYAVGNQYSLLDSYLGMLMIFMMKMGAISPDDPLVAYATPHSQRPALAKVMAGLEQP